MKIILILIMMAPVQYLWEWEQEYPDLDPKREGYYIEDQEQRDTRCLREVRRQHPNWSWRRIREECYVRIPGVDQED